MKNLRSTNHQGKPKAEKRTRAPSAHKPHMDVDDEELDGPSYAVERAERLCEIILGACSLLEVETSEIAATGAHYTLLVAGTQARELVKELRAGDDWQIHQHVKRERAAAGVR